MLAQILTLMGFQVAGEVIVTILNLSLPGPLCGLGLLFAWLRVAGGPSEGLARVAQVLIDHLGLLFVPAAAAVIGVGAQLLGDGVAIAVAIVGSTALSILVGGLAASQRAVHRAGQSSP
jgi:holin-like protein